MTFYFTIYNYQNTPEIFYACPISFLISITLFIFSGAYISLSLHSAHSCGVYFIGFSSFFIFTISNLSFLLCRIQDIKIRAQGRPQPQAAITRGCLLRLMKQSSPSCHCHPHRIHHRQTH